MIDIIRVAKGDEGVEDVKANVAVIAELAYEIWTQHYTPIIGADQVDYMLDRFQSVEQMHRDIYENGFIYLLGRDAEDGEPVGYATVVPKDGCLLLSKLYVLAQCRGRGCARVFLSVIEGICREEYGLDTIRLTVNKHNHGSIAAYEKMGFVTVDSVVADIGGGYFMDDYLMEKRL